MPDSIPTTAEVIEGIVHNAYGHADLLIQHHFRASLQMLVALAMAEQRRDSAMELQDLRTDVHRIFPH